MLNLEMYSILLDTVRQILKKSEFHEVRLPSIHPGQNRKREVFNLDFFGEIARLSPSNGLYSTIMASKLGKVYSIQRCYRPEKNQTYKHLSEFDMLIVSFKSNGFDDLITFLTFFIREVFREASNMLPIKATRFENVPVLEYEIINKKYSLNNGCMDGHETTIAARNPVIITKLPSKISLWNARSFDDNHSFSLNLLVPYVGELAEGCLRETRKEVLRRKLINSGTLRQLEWLIKLNSQPNAEICSFGLGIERLAMWLLRIADIREISYFYRDSSFMEVPQSE